jgi:hypothetical protein
VVRQCTRRDAPLGEAATTQRLFAGDLR